jgi:hypothetical protein
MTYTTDGNTVFIGKRAIATMMVGNFSMELAVMQGVPRMEVVNRIVDELPEFAAKEGITKDTVPSLISENRLRQLNKK